MMFKLLETNIDTIATLADGSFIDPLVRPKNKRKKFTAAKYKETCLARIEFWREQEDIPINHFSGFEDYTLQALQNQFQRFRDIYCLLMRAPSIEHPNVLAEQKAAVQKIRTEQREMDWKDRKLKCPICGLPVYTRDINNNYIDLKKRGKREVCQHRAGANLRSKMKTVREARRVEQKKKQRIPKKDPLRYKK